MKTSRILALAIAALSLGLAAPIILAQDAPPPPPKGEHEGHHKGPRDPLKMLTEKLNLTADQQAKLKPIAEEQKKALDAVRDDASLEKDAKKAKAKEIWQAYQPKIRALLTPEQQVKFDEMKEDMGRGPGGHKPPKEKE
jgi:Spy/CpxP family protein refolding chaperone